MNGSFKYQVQGDSIKRTQHNLVYPYPHKYSLVSGTDNQWERDDTGLFIANLGAIMNERLELQNIDYGKAYKGLNDCTCPSGALFAVDSHYVYLNIAYDSAEFEIALQKGEESLGVRYYTSTYSKSFKLIEKNEMRPFPNNLRGLALTSINVVNGNKWIGIREANTSNFYMTNWETKDVTKSTIFQLNGNTKVETYLDHSVLDKTGNFMAYGFYGNIVLPQYSLGGRLGTTSILRINAENGKLVFHSYLDTAMRSTGMTYSPNGRFLYNLLQLPIKADSGIKMVLRQYDWEKYIQTGVRTYIDFLFPAKKENGVWQQLRPAGLVHTSNGLITGQLISRGYFWIKNPDSLLKNENVVLRVDPYSSSGPLKYGWPNQYLEIKNHVPIPFNWDSAWNAPPPVFKLHVPTAFSPNADGLNDKYKVWWQSASNNTIHEFEIQIFDKTRGTVFKSNDPFFEWDGTNKSGNLVQDGVFLVQIHYKIDGMQKVERRRSVLHLLR